ncbi:MAG: PspC domain-containing protein [Alistipes sp.]|nr:PspC domain-containing protein [Alistipes sp.]
MKETVNVNIGSVAFTLDDDAYRTLKHYLKRIENRLPATDKETLDDIEHRVAELLSEKLYSPQQVVTLAEVESAMQQIGDPDTFGKAREADPEMEQEQEQAQPSVKRLYRPRVNRSIAGVCSGIADYFNLDVTLIRLVTFLMIFLGSLSIWIYVILWIVIPEEPIREFNNNTK